MDRNPIMQCFTVVSFASLSARRAWIEIPVPSAMSMQYCVALRKESVDRNVAVGILAGGGGRRSPQGERG